MEPTLREDLAVIGTTAAALFFAALSVAGGILLGLPRTVALLVLLIATYLAVWGTLRLTTKALRRPAPADPDDTED